MKQHGQQFIRTKIHEKAYVMNLYAMYQLRPFMSFEKQIKQLYLCCYGNQSKSGIWTIYIYKFK